MQTVNGHNELLDIVERIEEQRGAGEISTSDYLRLMRDAEDVAKQLGSSLSQLAQSKLPAPPSTLDVPGQMAMQDDEAAP